jgi:hypothetical protein
MLDALLPGSSLALILAQPDSKAAEFAMNVQRSTSIRLP